MNRTSCNALLTLHGARRAGCRFASIVRQNLELYFGRSVLRPFSNLTIQVSSGLLAHGLRKTFLLSRRPGGGGLCGGGGGTGGGP